MSGALASVWSRIEDDLPGLAIYAGIVLAVAAVAVFLMAPPRGSGWDARWTYALIAAIWIFGLAGLLLVSYYMPVGFDID